MLTFALICTVCRAVMVDGYPLQCALPMPCYTCTCEVSWIAQHGPPLLLEC